MGGRAPPPPLAASAACHLAVGRRRRRAAPSPEPVVERGVGGLVLLAEDEVHKVLVCAGGCRQGEPITSGSSTRAAHEQPAAPPPPQPARSPRCRPPPARSPEPWARCPRRSPKERSPPPNSQLMLPLAAPVPPPRPPSPAPAGAPVLVVVRWKGRPACAGRPGAARQQPERSAGQGRRAPQLLPPLPGRGAGAYATRPPALGTAAAAGTAPCSIVQYHRPTWLKMRSTMRYVSEWLPYRSRSSREMRKSWSGGNEGATGEWAGRGWQEPGAAGQGSGWCARCPRVQARPHTRPSKQRQQRQQQQRQQQQRRQQQRRNHPPGIHGGGGTAGATHPCPGPRTCSTPRKSARTRSGAGPAVQYWRGVQGVALV